MHISRALTDQIDTLLLSDQLDAAEDLILPMADANPDDFTANLKLGGLYMKRGEWIKACARLHHCLTLQPHSEQAWYGYAFSRWMNGDYEESIMSYRQLISVSPQHTEALIAAGEACYRAQKYWDAYGFYRRYMDIFPHNRSEMLPKMVICLEHAEKEQSNNMDIKIALCETLKALDSHAHAHELRLRAIHCDPREYCKRYPDDAVALAVKITHSIKVCNWESYEVDVAHLRDLIKYAGESCDPVFNTFGTTQEEQYVNTQRFIDFKYQDIIPYQPDRHIDGKPVRLAYLSSDFHEHATAYLISGLLEAHDKTKFHITAYSTGVPDNSPMRARIVSAVDKFVDISKLSLAEAYDTIREDNIDILIDLKGWCEGHAMDLLAKRPAPILVHYLGYPGTTGICDYIIADDITIPEANQRWFTERVIHLPGSYQVNTHVDTSRLPVTTRAQYNLPGDAIVYGCFNQAYKITPSVYRDWLTFLIQEPKAVLWVLVMNSEQIINLRHYASQQGISPDRIIEMRFVNQQEHLSRMRLADYYLDTAPVCGHTTTSDAIRMGVKIIRPNTSCPCSFISNVTDSLLENQDTLFDTAAKTRQIEQAYLSMVDEYNALITTPDKEVIAAQLLCNE